MIKNLFYSCVFLYGFHATAASVTPAQLSQNADIVWNGISEPIREYLPGVGWTIHTRQGTVVIAETAGAQASTLFFLLGYGNAESGHSAQKISSCMREAQVHNMVIAAATNICGATPKAKTCAISWKTVNPASQAFASCYQTHY